jgi:hypothetical protein
VAVIQSLVRKAEVSDLIAGYGPLIVGGTDSRFPRFAGRNDSGKRDA